jgi:uncharacterized protein YgiM (DUF1202 family)
VDGFTVSTGGKMSIRVRFLLLFAGICFALPASAADEGTVVCGVNQDRVWVYTSLTSFDVEAKLKCGETVEIVERVKGYVKIRDQSGREGYIPDSALPKMPVFEDNNDKPVAGNSSKQSPPSRAVVHPAAATSDPAAMPSKPVASVSANVTPGASKPLVPTFSATPSESEHAGPNGNTILSTNANPPLPASPAQSANPASKPKTASVAVTKKGTGTAGATSTHSPVTATDQVVANSADAINVDSSIPPASVYATTQPVSASADPEEDLNPPSFKAEDYSICQVYFSAYGLSANQYRWFVQNRKKNHPTVCPAPAPGLVDFVIIFTHDVDFFSYTMPTTYRTDSHGFSDFTPLVTINTPAMSQFDADKAHHEYVWVFHTTRGAFDPEKFSSRRHPLFTKSESNSFGSRAGDRTVEDALAFIEGRDATR